jgi:hypothetical protein
MHPLLYGIFTDIELEDALLYQERESRRISVSQSGVSLGHLPSRALSNQPLIPSHYSHF